MRALVVASILALVLPSAAFAQGAKPAPQQPALSFGKAASGGRERAVLGQFRPEMAADEGLETAVVDIDEDKVVEVFARARSKAFCDEGGKRCRTVMLKYARGKWAIGFDRSVEKIELGERGYAAMPALVLDGGRETDRWTGEAYAVDLAATGKQLAFSPAPANAAALLAAQFGTAAVTLQKAGRAKVSVAEAALEGSESVVVAKLEGDGACGRVLGCPLRGLKVKDGTYQTVFEGFSTGGLSVMPVARGGWKDIITESKGGYALYGWGGAKYGLAERQIEGVAR